MRRRGASFDHRRLHRAYHATGDGRCWNQKQSVAGDFRGKRLIDGTELLDGLSLRNRLGPKDLSFFSAAGSCRHFNSISASQKPDEKKAEKRKIHASKTFKCMLRFIYPEDRPDLKIRLGASLGSLFAAKYLLVQVPVYLGEFVNAITDAAQSGDISSLLTAEAALTALTLSIGARFGAAFFNELKTWLFADVMQHGCKKQGEVVFKHLHKQDIDYLQTLKGGEIQTMVSRALRSMTMVLNTLIQNLAPTLIEFGLVMKIVSVKLGAVPAGIVFSTFGTYMWFTTWYSEKRRAQMKRVVDCEDKCGGLLVDSVVNAEAVRYFGKQRFEEGRYGEQLKAFEKAQVAVQRSLAYLNGGQSAILTTGQGIVLLWATAEVCAGVLTPGDVVCLAALLRQLEQPLNFLGGAYRVALQGLMDVQKMEQLMHVKPVIRSGTEKFVYKNGDIEFRNVSWRGVVKDVSFKIKGGMKVGICGPSGAGKSTLLKLLCRLRDPDNLSTGGQILIDGQRLDQLDLQSYMQHLGVVPQETILFNDSAQFNVEYGAEDGAEDLHDRVVQACQQAQIHRTLDERGYDKSVGERGASLSGGERQRVAIARCLLRNPNFILFDEATSALDTQTEFELKESMSSFLEDEKKTVLMVAHRLSMLQNCDLILYMEDGRVCESGTHAELFGREGGGYRQLWDLQEEMGKNQVFE